MTGESAEPVDVATRQVLELVRDVAGGEFGLLVPEGSEPLLVADEAVAYPSSREMRFKGVLHSPAGGGVKVLVVRLLSDGGGDSAAYSLEVAHTLDRRASGAAGLMKLYENVPESVAGEIARLHRAVLELQSPERVVAVNNLMVTRQPEKKKWYWWERYARPKK